MLRVSAQCVGRSLIGSDQIRCEFRPAATRQSYKTLYSPTRKSDVCVTTTNRLSTMHEAMIVSHSPDGTCVDELSSPAREHCSGISWRQTEWRVDRQRVEHSDSPTAATVLLLNGLSSPATGVAARLEVSARPSTSNPPGGFTSMTARCLRCSGKSTRSRICGLAGRTGSVRFLKAPERACKG